MKIRVRPGRNVGGMATVPGDKSIAHRWLILAGTAQGRSEILGLPASLDVGRTVSIVAQLTGSDPGEDGGAWLEGKGRRSLVEPGGPLNCGNSGTTMRLIAG